MAEFDVNTLRKVVKNLFKLDLRYLEAYLEAAKEISRVGLVVCPICGDTLWLSPEEASEEIRKWEKELEKLKILAEKAYDMIEKASLEELKDLILSLHKCRDRPPKGLII